VIKSDQNKDSGYLAILVERSERRPHMCNFDKHYYKRIGGNSFKMEHYDIEDAFKRMSLPDLDVVYELNEGTSDPASGYLREYGGTFVEIIIKFYLKNQSAITATSPYLVIKSLDMGQNCLAKSYFSRPEFQCAISSNMSGDEIKKLLSSYKNMNDAIHPEMELYICSIHLGPILVYTQGENYNYNHEHRIPDSVSLDFRFGCANTRPKSRRLEIPEADLRAYLQSNSWFVPPRPRSG